MTRRQLYASAALLLAAATLTTARGPTGAQRPPAPNSPPQYPAQESDIRYTGSVGAALAPGDGFILRLVARATAGHPYDILGVHQGYPGITTEVIGTLPRTVTPGQQVVIDVRYLVTDCTRAPADAGLPFLDVTLRNTRAIQTLSQILGPDYTLELSRNLHATCSSSDIRTRTPDSSAPNSTVR
ncbi:hypothetical protein [Kitasatospora sp. NPDC050543]|uniref:hypothetical protein n=1 Tax=Kitasatospora sp. NPDC050543 TaxID=3364054 RepID=UPI0037B6879D